MIAQHPKAARGTALAVLLVASCGTYLAVVAVFWIGFMASDDNLYWAGSSGWLAHFPYLGTTHWALRHTLVVPMAIARALLGDGMPAMVLPSLLYGVGVVVLTTVWINRAAGLPAAIAAMALIVTNSQFVLLSSIANVDLVEAFFVLLTAALLHGSIDAEDNQSRRLSLLLLSGVSAGLAMLSRETAAFAIVAFGLLFLAGYGMRRAWYLVAGAAGAAVMALELLFVWRMSGDLFYRATISLHHDETIDRWLDQGARVPLVHPAVDPLTMLLFNHSFGLLTWIGLPLTVWLMWRANLAIPARRLAVITITLAATWTLLAAGAWSELNLAPRYFLLPALLLSIPCGMALAQLWGRGARVLAAVPMLALIAANLLSSAIDYRNTLTYGEHMLVDIAARAPAVVHTDPKSLARAELLLQWQGLVSRVTQSAPGHGDLYFLDPARSDVRPDDDWVVVERHGLPSTIGQRLAARILPPRMLSPTLWSRLGSGHPDVTLYRIP
jgi:4-amino-4-deoxy-L-arabinose transferase-like glycosyltransferase